jgi:hypothetical protein
LNAGKQHAVLQVDNARGRSAEGPVSRIVADVTDAIAGDDADAQLRAASTVYTAPLTKM